MPVFWGCYLFAVLLLIDWNELCRKGTFDLEIQSSLIRSIVRSFVRLFTSSLVSVGLFIIIIVINIITF